MPGLIYIALGDPLQKRNYYRTGWLRFHEDADMPAVMAELSEKKVILSVLYFQSLQSKRPFNRLRLKDSSCMLRITFDPL